MTNEQEPQEGRRCDVCQSIVPASVSDKGLGLIDGDPVSLINHRWTAHGIVGITRCELCAEPLRTDSLARHLSRSDHDKIAEVDDDITEVDDKITEVGDNIAEVVKELDKKLDRLLQEVSWVRSLFWVIVAAVITAELLYPLAKAIIAAFRVH